MKINTNGFFLISLDYELMWGVRDKKSIKNYGVNILNVFKSSNYTLELFNRYNINATFATVGFLFHPNKKDLMDFLPYSKPSYTNKNLSPYENDYIGKIGDNEQEDPYHFGYRLLKKIIDTNKHEIASHTYSHYYCLELGQTLDQFRVDLQKNIEIAKRNNIELNSIVFPRNQYDKKYLDICRSQGIMVYRGNEKHFMYKPSESQNQTKLNRMLRLADSYLNLSGHNTYSIKDVINSKPYDLKSSRFLRPYKPMFSFFDFLKLKRIKDSMSYAARNNEIFHLWWHPHNFGSNIEENIKFLEQILLHYEMLNKKYKFKSVTMSKLAKIINS